MSVFYIVNIMRCIYCICSYLFNRFVVNRGANNLSLNETIDVAQNHALLVVHFRWLMMMM